MKIYIIYIIVFICYLINKNFITSIIRFKKIDPPLSLSQLSNRLLYLTNFNFLISSYYFYNSNSETYLIALFFSLIVPILFYIKFYNTNDFTFQLIDHMLPIIPLLIFRTDLSNIKFTSYSISLLIISIYYFTINRFIYF